MVFISLISVRLISLQISAKKPFYGLILKLKDEKINLWENFLGKSFELKIIFQRGKSIILSLN